jgi:hypothetical protein
MLLFEQLKTWIYWKAKIRWSQTWGNFKLYNLENKLVIPFTAIGFKIIGILIVFALGFGVAFLFNKFLSSDPYAFWQVAFFVFIFVEGTTNGLATGRWISSTNEENWLLASTPIGTVKYLVFLWIDESLWMLRNSFFSNTAGVIGALLVFPVQLKYLAVAFLFVGGFYLLISLVMTLLHYYIIKKSVYLKGKGFIANLLLPCLAMPIIYVLTKYLSPWLITFPVVPSSSNFLMEYVDWFKEGFNVLLNSGDAFFGIIDKWYYPYSLLSELMVNGSFLTPVITSTLYILFLVAIVSLLIRVISRKDNVTNVENSPLDDFITKFFLLISKWGHNHKLNEKHVELYLTSLLKHYLAKRSIFATLGSSVWPIITFLFTFLYFVPIELRMKFSLVFALLIAVYFPFIIITSIYNKMKVKLSFDSEGPHMQVLIAYGASPEYLFQLKTKMVQILSLPGFLVSTIATLLFLPIPFWLKGIALLLSLLTYFFVSRFIVLPSFLVPHYEFYNLDQIGKYPDQISMKNNINTLIISVLSPIIPATMYLLNDIGKYSMIAFSTTWITCGAVIGSFFLTRILNNRLSFFNIEEISVGFLNNINKSFWKEKSVIIAFTFTIYVLGAVLSIFRQFVFAEILVLFPLIIIQVILISSYNQNTNK